MKKIIIFTLLSASFSVQAAVVNSDLDQRHQDLIAKTVAEKCDLTDDLIAISQSVEVEKVDQGIYDTYFTTTFETTDLYDQFISDKYLVTVKSVKSDSYDHVNKNWGTYSVQSVQCVRAE